MDAATARMLGSIQNGTPRAWSQQFWLAFGRSRGFLSGCCHGAGACQHPKWDPGDVVGAILGYFGGIPSPPLWRPQTHQKPPFRHLRPGSTMYTQELSANVSGCPDSPRVGWTCEVLGSPMARGKTEGRGTRAFPCEVSFVRTAPSGAPGSLRPLGLGFLTLPERAPEANLELHGGGFRLPE